MSYLDQILASTKDNQARNSSMQSLLQKLAAPPSPAPAPDMAGSPAPLQGGGGGGYSGPMAGNVDTQHVDPRLRSAVEQLIAASHGQIGINSGYRDIARQAQLYQQALQKYGSAQEAGRWVAPPGHSRHNEGEAVDLALRNAAAVAYAHQHAAEYGLTFPLSNENWHVELAGPRRQ